MVTWEWADLGDGFWHLFDKRRDSASSMCGYWSWQPGVEPGRVKRLMEDGTEITSNVMPAFPQPEGQLCAGCLAITTTIALDGK